MANKHIFKNDTLTLTLTDREGYWLYDKTRGMNLSMNAKTEQEAFVEALMYYQKRLLVIEKSLTVLQGRVDAFIEGFVDDCDEE